MFLASVRKNAGTTGKKMKQNCCEENNEVRGCHIRNFLISANCVNYNRNETLFYDRIIFFTGLWSCENVGANERRSFFMFNYENSYYLQIRRTCENSSLISTKKRASLWYSRLFPVILKFRSQSEWNSVIQQNISSNFAYENFLNGSAKEWERESKI